MCHYLYIYLEKKAFVCLLIYSFISLFILISYRFECIYVYNHRDNVIQEEEKNISWL